MCDSKSTPPSATAPTEPRRGAVRSRCTEALLAHLPEDKCRGLLRRWRHQARRGRPFLARAGPCRQTRRRCRPQAFPPLQTARALHGFPRRAREIRDGGRILLQLSDVFLHPVRAEVRLLHQRLQIGDEPQIAGRAGRLHRLSESAVALDRRSALTADERQRASQQIFPGCKHEILIADAESDDALGFRIDADVERRAGGSARLVVAARSPESVLNRFRRRQPVVQEFRPVSYARCRLGARRRTPAPCRAARRRLPRTRRTHP